MADVRMKVAAYSDIGRVRRNNEDAFTVTDLDSGTRIESRDGVGEFTLIDKGLLLALSDGMGGHQAGEIASALVIESLRDALLANGGVSRIEDLICAAVLKANTAVLQAARAGKKSGMGATLTAILVRGAEAYVAEVGDSRAYLLRGGKLQQITRDQSLLQIMIDRGIVTTEEAKQSPQKNIILQALGLADEVRVAISLLRCRQGDRLLLCCDGLSNALSEEEICSILVTADPQESCKQMIDLANERGGRDNLTAIVAHLDGEGLPVSKPSESVTNAFEVIQAFEPQGTSSSASAGPQQPVTNEVITPETGPPFPNRVEPEGRLSVQSNRRWPFFILIFAFAIIVLIYYIFR